MSFLKTIVDRGRIGDGLKTLSVILLLALYIGGNTSYGLFHGHDSFQSHSVEKENDPCHRAIYHFEKENGCKHQSHFSKNEKCCECHLLCHSDQLIIRTSSTPFLNTDSIIRVVLTFSHLEGIFLYHPSRAPPLS